MISFFTSERPVRVIIAVSTIGARASGFVLPPQTEGLAYIIFIQSAREPELDFERADVTCVFLQDRGLSNNRNAALEMCNSPYLLFSDDDLKLDPQAILSLADILDANPKLAFVTGWRAGRSSLPRAGVVRWFNAGHICAPELMIRTESVRTQNIFFDPAFGVGAQYPIGEDFIFVCDILRAGLQGRSVPVVVGSHSGTSSGENWEDPWLLSARKAMLARCFGRWHGLVRLLYALRQRRRLGGWWAALSFAFTNKR